MWWCTWRRRSSLKEKAVPRSQCHSHRRAGNWWRVSSNSRLIFFLALWTSLPAATCRHSRLPDKPRSAPGAGWRVSSPGTRQRDSPGRPSSVTLFQRCESRLFSHDLICIQPRWLGKRRPQLPESLRSPHNPELPGCTWGSASDVFSETQAGAFLKLVHIIHSNDFKWGKN